MAGEYAGIKRIVHISSIIGEACKECGEFISGEEFQEAVNHYLVKHGYTLLHVGTETVNDDHTGDPWHTTVAVLGK